MLSVGTSTLLPSFTVDILGWSLGVLGEDNPWWESESVIEAALSRKKIKTILKQYPPLLKFLSQP